MSNVEMEVKLALNEQRSQEFLHHPLVSASVVPNTSKLLRLTSIYYDTVDLDLAHNGLTYRLRQTNEAWEATVKTQGTTVDGFSRRGEFTVQLPAKKFVLKGFAKEIDDQLAQLINTKTLVELFRVVVKRRITHLRLSSGAILEMAQDEGSILGKNRQEPIREVELELLQGKEQELLAFVAEIEKTVPLERGTASKFKRGLDLIEKSGGV